MRKIKLAVIGCGGRGKGYMSLASQMKTKYQLVAAADPIPARLDALRKIANDPNFKTYPSDLHFFADPKMADIVIIGTQDSYHVEPCVKAMELGYDVLLEKPISTKIEDVLTLARLAKKLTRKVLVCHVLRYAPLYRKVKEIIDSGALGKIVSLNATEGVDPWHQCHSYVRGHWAVKEKSSPMIIAKSCHDMDIISWLVGKKCLAVSSFGSLSHFTAANAPAGAPARCTDGCPVEMECKWNALRYLNQHKSWLQYVYDESNPTNEQIIAWLSKSPWGRCAFRCDNNVVDHQVVAMNFDDAVTATFTMTAFARHRSIEIYGTKAVLRGGGNVKECEGVDIVVEEHVTSDRHTFVVSHSVGGYDGHGGGDAGLVSTLYDEMLKDNPDDMLSSIAKSVESHLMGFAAEKSRITGTSINLQDFQKENER